LASTLLLGRGDRGERKPMMKMGGDDDNYDPAEGPATD